MLVATSSLVLSCMGMMGTCPDILLLGKAMIKKIMIV